MPEEGKSLSRSQRRKDGKCKQPGWGWEERVGQARWRQGRDGAAGGSPEGHVLLPSVLWEPLEVLSTEWTSSWPNRPGCGRGKAGRPGQSKGAGVGAAVTHGSWGGTC